MTNTTEQKFEFTGYKSTAITLQELGKSFSANNYDVPSHNDGISRIIETVREKYEGTKLQSMYVSNKVNTGWSYNQSSTGAQNQTALLEYFTFHKVIARIDVPVPFSKGNMHIAIKYDHNRFTIGVGANISICSNFMIMGQGDMITTGVRGKDRLSFDNAIDIIGNWMLTMNQKAIKMNNSIEKMENRILQPGEVNQLIGILARRSTPPQKPILMGYQVTKLCKNVNAAMGKEKKPISVFDFWNYATNDIKPENTDVSSYLDTTLNVTRFCNSFPDRNDLKQINVN